MQHIKNQSECCKTLNQGNEKEPLRLPENPDIQRQAKAVENQGKGDINENLRFNDCFLAQQADATGAAYKTDQHEPCDTRKPGYSMGNIASNGTDDQH